ncbi:MAG: PspA/IM30 family protein [Deltaproteobacteria bacterium]|nr:PspA/IM30 family protein [Deltaproteobacteria bacterium]
MSVVSRLEAFLESILGAAEDPAERIQHLVSDLRRRQAEGKRALGMSIALEKRLLADLCAAEDARIAWEKVSKEALEQRDEAKAQDAAARLLAMQDSEKAARQRWEEQRDVAAKVKAAVQEAARRTGEVAHAKTVLLARARSAEAMKSIADALQVLESPEVKRTVTEAQLHAERREAEAKAAQQGQPTAG